MAHTESGRSRIRVIVLGSTGSIGTQTLDAIEHLNALHDRDPRAQPALFEVVGLLGGRRGDVLAAQAARFGVRHVVGGVVEPRNGTHATRDHTRSAAVGSNGRAGTDLDPAERLVREVECDVVVSAMVGVAGLPATLAAVELGRDVALANKETLVAAGSLIVPAARASGARLLPVDSEHSALWQCLAGSRDSTGASAPCPPMVCGPEVARVVLTASGGALRHLSRAEAYHAAPEQALAHPTWNMGAKVTLDSASLTNKAFEIIEAHWLFGLESRRIDVLIHPQSIVHSLVEFADGSIIAQLGSPDMRGPIQYALTYPARPAGCSAKLDLRAMSRLDFSPPSRERFPALGLAYRVIDAGGTAGAIFNAASEEATHAYLASHRARAPVAAVSAGAAPAGPGPLAFGRIPELAEAAMDALGVSPVRDLEDVLEADAAARRFVRERHG
ncbi:MAG: 1-deoxy-D-xylulose-5-phosphate reductoisomerase [Phycisphaerales bacterium]